MTTQQSPLRFFLVWLSLGMQSFGGGVATFALIRDAAVSRYAWITEEEFTNEWAMVQIAPGINLLALTILIGKRARGTMGICMAVAGLLLPSVIVTVLITAGYAHIRGLKTVQAALKGALPAIVALGLLTSIQMAIPILKTAHKESRTTFAACILLLAVCGALAVRSNMPIVAILLAGGFISGAFNWLCKRGDVPLPQGPAAE